MRTDLAVGQELELSVPTLIKVGLFDLFAPEEWIAESNPGRAYVGTLAETVGERLTQWPAPANQK
jgi:hypothetical protein